MDLGGEMESVCGGQSFFTGRLLRMLVTFVLLIKSYVTHDLLFFHPSQSVRQEGQGME